MFDFEGLEARLTAPVTARMLELASLRPGQRVLDVGCGVGPVAIAAHERVVPGGRVLGFDVDERAIATARLTGGPTLSFEVAAGESFECVARFDAALARWSLASMSDPPRALRSIGRVLEPGAPFVFATWASAQWWSTPREVIERFVTLPTRPSEAPGSMRFAELERALSLLAPTFQFEASEQLTTPVVGGPPELLVAWVEHVFPAWLGAVPDLEACRTALRAEFTSCSRLEGVTHLVLARRVGS